VVDMTSPLAASAAQTALRARDAALERDSRRAGEADATDRPSRAVDEFGRTVHTADADDRVFSDSEGQGSEGRSREEPALPSAPAIEDDDSETSGITRDADGRLHLDVEA